jgi:hypothetical protein
MAEFFNIEGEIPVSLMLRLSEVPAEFKPSAPSLASAKRRLGYRSSTGVRSVLGAAQRHGDVGGRVLAVRRQGAGALEGRA